jgi:hypothetical protein
MKRTKKELMDLIEKTTSKLMIENDKSKSNLFALKKTLDSTDPHHPLYADLVKRTERQEIFFEQIYNITDLSNRIIEDFREQSSYKNQKQDIQEICQQFKKIMSEIKQE